LAKQVGASCSKVRTDIANAAAELNDGVNEEDLGFEGTEQDPFQPSSAGATQAQQKAANRVSLFRDAFAARPNALHLTEKQLTNCRVNMY
jgi:hypothetical protein